ncbi:hypothetical protein LP123_12495 [Moraxella bovis]|uniref:Uncharacterized protein n=1 Tax=Moraxella bovis TaxID=476 RepID=A0AAQ2QAR6_MORBO|nr:hypothetical protein [Moraxella bovis]AWY19386.1 hypothetical protein DQF64_01835 [Moraxella bovis]OOR89022.1 hypothetical protein B0182_08140 [Moraxella bovis]UYZ76095.1 hypothetical protein LP093_01810 [Moraxella bovis]UYZ77952.1 hypothetical protein LP115_11985 [Moraxella bovis]UYZ80841.1 hypothetical protein LP113_12635 [Moraxella bovis]
MIKKCSWALGLWASISLCAYANTLQTDMVQTDTGTQLVVSQKNATGHSLDMPPAQLGISPPRLDLTASATTNQRVDTSVTFYNYGDTPKRIQVTLTDADTDFVPIASGQDTLKPWVLIAPQNFEIKAGGYQTIRLSFRLPAGFAQKSHYAFLNIKQHIDNPIVSQSDNLTVVKIGSQYQLPIRLTVK